MIAAAPPPAPAFPVAKVSLYCDKCCRVSIAKGEQYTNHDGKTICPDCQPIPPEARWG